MKRAFAILALATLLTGCGSSKAPAATTAPTAAPTETTVAASRIITIMSLNCPAKIFSGAAFFFSARRFSPS